jgi:transposase
VERYLGLDVHAQSCTLAVISEAGKRLKDVVVESNGQALIEAIRTVPGRKHLCIEEGTQSTWLYEILSPRVYEMVVAGLIRSLGPKSDKIDAYGLAERHRTGQLEQTVFKAPSEYGLLRELARHHSVVGRDLVRVQARLKSLYRSRGIATPGGAVYGTRQRKDYLDRLPAICRRRAARIYEQIDFLVQHKADAEKDLLEELSQHRIARMLQTCPGLGPIRVARLLPIVVTPHRFRTRQQFWSYCGLGIVMRSSADWVQTPQGEWVRAQVAKTRGLDKRHNHVLKDIFKGAATTVLTSHRETSLFQSYERRLEAGTKPNLAKLTLARTIAATTLKMWKDEEPYHPTSRTEQSPRAHGA